MTPLRICVLYSVPGLEFVKVSRSTVLVLVIVPNHTIPGTLLRDKRSSARDITRGLLLIIYIFGVAEKRKRRCVFRNNTSTRAASHRTKKVTMEEIDSGEAPVSCYYFRYFGPYCFYFVKVKNGKMKPPSDFLLSFLDGRYFVTFSLCIVFLIGWFSRAFCIF